MYIQELLPKTVIAYAIKANEQKPSEIETTVANEQKPSEIKTTVDLSRLDLRSWDQNIIQNIQWVDWAGESQGWVTLADGATLFFDETITSTLAVSRMKIGDHIDIYNEGNSYFASGGRLADYNLSADKHDYTIEQRPSEIKTTVANEQKPSEIKTTVDLSRLDLRSWDQNIIQNIQWVDWAGESQGWVTLADGATLFFDDTITCTLAVSRMKIGDHIDIYNEGNSYFASGGRLADYNLSADKHDYTIEQRPSEIKTTVANEQKPSEIKTTVDLSRLDLRSWDQNIIQNIQWVDWAGESQGWVTLADGATLFFDDTITCTLAVSRMKIGDHIDIYKEGDSYFASGGRLADYSLSADKHDYTIRDR